MDTTITTSDLCGVRMPDATAHSSDSPDQIDQDASLAAKLAEEEANYGIECASDSTLAIMLQRQYDVEYDVELKRTEARMNGHSKVGISLDKFRRCPNSFSVHIESVQDDDEFYGDHHDSDRDIEPDTAWDVFEQSEIDLRGRTMGRSGVIVDSDGNMISKHDIPTSSRKNMRRLMELKTDIQTGDAGACTDDFKITNYVYNKLKVHSKKSSRKESQRCHDKRERENLSHLPSHKMSDATRAIMDGLLMSYKIEKLNGIIGHGKESTIYHATGRDQLDEPGQEVAIKIFNSDLDVAFKTRDTYNKSKFPSYKFDKPKSKNDSLNKWAERGFKNLKLMRRANINCPDAISLKKHVLLMTFLGRDSQPSPKLKDVIMVGEKLLTSYHQVLDIMKRMYQDCELIHGDLSEYNLLWHDDQPYVIDVSQSMFTSHPNANGFLYRDCRNIIDFYRRSGLTSCMDERELFKFVSGKDLDDKDLELWTKIEDFPRNEKQVQSEKKSSGMETNHVNHIFDAVMKCCEKDR